ncbi:MAG: hypothetical protein U1F76_16865 [Candidatus Competibacteraceae bacterium]
MNESPGASHEFLWILFWLSWVVLLYLAWPRLIDIGRRLLRRRPTGQPVRLLIPPVKYQEDKITTGLKWAVMIFLGLSLLELALRIPQLERFSLPLLTVCFGLLLLWRRRHHHPKVETENNEILFPLVRDNTAIGMRLLKVQDVLAQLRQSAAELGRRKGIYAQVAAPLREFIDSVIDFLQTIRQEPADSALLRQAQPLFIHLETLAEAFGLLARLAEQEEPGPLLEGAIEVLSSAKASFQALRTAQSQMLSSRADILIGVLRHLYRPAP